MLLAAVGTFAAFDGATLSLLPVYALRVGDDITIASLVLVPLVAGNVILQLPLGWLADRYPKRHVMAGCAAATVLCCAAIPLCVGSWMIWPILFVAGSTAYGLYTLALAELGERFKGLEVVQVVPLLRSCGDWACSWGHLPVAGLCFNSVRWASLNASRRFCHPPCSDTARRTQLDSDGASVRSGQLIA